MDLLVNSELYLAWGILIVRLVVGLVFVVHGLQKWPLWRAQPSEKMPSGQLSLMKLLSLVEPIAGVFLILGLFTWIVAAVLGVVMLGAIFMKIAQWQKRFTGDGGWELEFILLAVLILLIFTGARQFSLDNFFW